MKLLVAEWEKAGYKLPINARAVHTAPRHTSQVKAEMASKAPHTRRAALQSEAELTIFMTAFAFAGRRFGIFFWERVLETRKIIIFLLRS